MTKYNHKKIVKELAQIMDAKEKEEIRKRILNQLPRANNADTRDFYKWLGIEKPKPSLWE